MYFNICTIKTISHKPYTNKKTKTFFQKKKYSQTKIIYS